MSAECEKHGVDLHGSQWSEGGLVCPVCEKDKALEAAERRVEDMRLALEQWPGVATALLHRRPVRNLDELLVATESALSTTEEPARG